MKSNRSQSIREAARVHRSNILTSLERRLQAARARGDENLLQQLEAELRYYQ